MQKARRREQGFTLIELMVVLFILALLAALVGPKFIGQVGKAKPKAAAVQIQMLGNALDLFYLDVGRYPTTEEGLEILVKRPGSIPQWAGPYLDKGVPKDPWGRDYLYRFPGSHNNAYDLYSLGGDGSEGGEGENQDITNWTSETQ